MNKLIFTPFPTDKAGTLIGRLAYKPDIQAEKKGDGEYRGFKPDENKFAPHQKSPGVYDETKQFSILTNADDELYINAHCSKGIDYLANNEKCDAPGSVKVTIPDLILQLEAHGLPKTTKAKIKLWICEGALDNGDNKKPPNAFPSRCTLPAIPSAAFLVIRKVCSAPTCQGKEASITKCLPHQGRRATAGCGYSGRQRVHRSSSGCTTENEEGDVGLCREKQSQR